MQPGGGAQLGGEVLRRTELRSHRPARLRRGLVERRLNLLEQLGPFVGRDIGERGPNPREICLDFGRNMGCSRQAVTSTSVSSRFESVLEKSAQVVRASSSSARPQAVIP